MYAVVGHQLDNHIFQFYQTSRDNSGFQRNPHKEINLFFPNWKVESPNNNNSPKCFQKLHLES